MPYVAEILTEFPISATYLQYNRSLCRKTWHRTTQVLYNQSCDCWGLVNKSSSFKGTCPTHVKMFQAGAEKF